MKTAKKKREFSFPNDYEAPLRRELAALGYDLAQPAKLAQAVLDLSDFYLQRPDDSTPWSEPWAQAASLAYYFPLNYARNAAVALEARRLGFFEGLSEIEDIGCGMGSGLLAFYDTHPFQKARGSDLSDKALELCQALHHDRTRLDLRIQNTEMASRESQGLLLASFVLTELPEIPKHWYSAEALAIIEPSTQTDARRLQAYRKDLLSHGFEIWAPCTHQDDCPLLIHSEKDWCHDRIHWQAPDWFLEIEKRLPMKNRTLTFSYLLARKKRRPEDLSSYARLVGDMLIEKGKTRQALCRSEEREFLSWFPQRLKGQDTIDLDRGLLVHLDTDVPKKANELRLASPEKIRELPPAAPLFRTPN